MNEILFSKYSNERDKKFSIRTDIILEDGAKKIRKIPTTSDAANHVEGLYEKYEKLTAIYQKSGIQPNKCELINGELYFEYLEGETFEDKLNVLVEKKDYLSVVDQIREYVRKISEPQEKKKFQLSAEFVKVFGNVKVPSHLECLAYNNIDLIFSNIIINEKWNIIDYEWTFDFLIPLHFIIYRALHVFIMNSNQAQELKRLNLFTLFDISDEEIVLYEEMEKNFQKYVVGDRHTLLEFYEKVNVNCIDVKRLTEECFYDRIQIFWDYGQGYTEDNSTYMKCKQKNGRYEIRNVEIPKGVKNIRIDPIDRMSFVANIRILANGEQEMDYETNGTKEIGKIVFFGHQDPQIIITNMIEDITEIDIFFDCSVVQEVMGENILDIYQNIDAREEAISQLIEEKNRLNEEKNRLNEEKNRLNEEKNRLNEEKDELILKVEKIEKECMNLKNSTSYKITKPMRVIGKILKNDKSENN